MQVGPGGVRPRLGMRVPFPHEVQSLLEAPADLKLLLFKVWLVSMAESVVEADKTLVRFFIPAEARWPVVSGRQAFEWLADERPKTLGEQLTTTVRRIMKANETLQGVIDIVDFNQTRNGEREISDEALRRVIEILSDPRYRLGLDDVEPDFLGRAYEYLLRKFAEGQGQSAGEFFTPQEVGWLLAYLVEPRQGEEVHDPCCGSGGLLIKCQLALREREKDIKRPLKLFGQEWTGSSFAIARMNMVLHDMEGEIVRGNTMTNPKFLDDSRLKRFDVVVTNPMWNQNNFDPKSYETDPYERFESRGGGIERREVRARGAKNRCDHLPRLLLIVHQNDFEAAQAVAVHEGIAERVSHGAGAGGDRTNRQRHGER